MTNGRPPELEASPVNRAAVSVASAADVEAAAGPEPLLDDEPSRLALAFQRGDQSVLAALHECLRPLMVPVFVRYRDRPSVLPAALDSGDLAQESWLILAHLARRWRPEGGSFAAYFRVSFPWAVTRYVRRHSPSRRGKGVRVLGAERPEIQERLNLYAGTDGREWDGEIAWSELLGHLDDEERAVLTLHLVEQQPFTAVARALRLTRPAAYRLYRRALRRVQGSPLRLGRRVVVLDAEALNLNREGDLVDLVRALHAGAHADGRLPGRDWLAEQTGLSEQRLARLTALVVEAGCVRDRGPRRAGYLVYASPEETLATLGIRTDPSLRCASWKLASTCW